MFAKVAVNTGSTSPIDFLIYGIPYSLEDEVEIGSCVLVPLQNRQAVGYVTGIVSETDIKSTKLIISVLNGAIKLDQEMLDLAKWISDEYVSPMPTTLDTMLPGVIQSRIACKWSVCNDNPDYSKLEPEQVAVINEVKAGKIFGGNKENAKIYLSLLRKGILERHWVVNAPQGKPKVLKAYEPITNISESDLANLTQKQLDVIDVLKQADKPISAVELTQKYEVSVSSLASLEKINLITKTTLTVRRIPQFVELEAKDYQLSEDQQMAADAIISAMEKEAYHGFLLYGVTASGKTEVYMRSIERALEMGKTSLILLPEIALTTQVMNIFSSRFGDDVAVLHSALSSGERYDEWVRIQNGEARIVLGARSAVFAPLKNIGLIIVDEEHEQSFKQENQPRYHARDAAVQRAKTNNAVLVLGSATPCAESYQKAMDGELTFVKMLSRIQGRSLPNVCVADLRDEYKRGQATIFSSQLQEKISDCLNDKKQIMLLQNRRAYSTFLLCRECGYVPGCPNCSVTLKYHSKTERLMCHHCDYSKDAPTQCPKCEGTKIGKFGIGTQRVEEETARLYPEARILRLDKDTTTTKGSHSSIIESFRKGEADILIGTQMIAKGLDFPNVTLVGVISADTSLNIPDFRASERTFQLISQVAGRSGRGESAGEVVVQTFDPDNYAIAHAISHDYISFMCEELESRKSVLYPPYSCFVNIISDDKSAARASQALDELKREIKQFPLSDRKDIDIFGPRAAAVSKVNGIYRMCLLLKSTDKGRILNILTEIFASNPTLRQRVDVDVDPTSVL